MALTTSATTLLLAFAICVLARGQTVVADPPVYVIQDEPQLDSSGSSVHWNNQKLTRRAHELQISAKQRLASDEYDTANQASTNDVFESNQYMSPMLSYASGSATSAAVKGRRMSGSGHKSATKGGSSSSRKKPTSVRPKVASVQPKFGSRSSSKSGKNMICYYGTWAVYRPDAGKFAVENIDPFLCTHIIYGFTGLSFDNTIKPLDPYNDLEDNYGKGAMKRFTGLKRQNPDLKTLVAIGGWNEGSIKYSRMASEPQERAKFIRSVLDFLARYNFDGLDLDWEYPGSRGGRYSDKQNYVALLRELHQAFEPHGYLLTAAVAAGLSFMEPAYDIPEVSKYLDFINLMAYDYHGGWEPRTGLNAPLFASKRHDLTKQDQQLNVNWSVNHWLSAGAPPEKLVLGVGSYGRSFTLNNAQSNGINAPANQRGQAGPYTREPGTLGYNELCESFKRQPDQWTIVRDPDYLAPYAYNNERQWVGYDDPQSIALKAQYAKSMALGGVMMWSLETDDFQGRCHGERYPLLMTVKRVLGAAGAGPATSTSTPGSGFGSSTARPTSSATTPRTTTTTTTTTTTRRPLVLVTPGHEVEEERPGWRPSTARPPWRPPVTASTAHRTTTTTTTTTTARPPSSRPPTTGAPQPGGQFTCQSAGMFADPSNCRKFIRCVDQGARYSIFRFDCAPGTAFNEQFQYCDYIYNVPRCSAARSSPFSQRSQAEATGGWW